MASSGTDIWYSFIYTDGNPFKGFVTTTMRVEPSKTDVDDFRALVFDANSALFPGMGFDNFRLYSDKTMISQRAPLGLGGLIAGHGLSRETPVYVVVDAPVIGIYAEITPVVAGTQHVSRGYIQPTNVLILEKLA